MAAKRRGGNKVVITFLFINFIIMEREDRKKNSKKEEDKVADDVLEKSVKRTVEGLNKELEEMVKMRKLVIK